MYIADLHIHSRYSRATSKDGTPEQLDLWARRKGIAIVGTGDFTHPAWREELAEKLAPAEDGLYVLKEEYRIPDGPVSDAFYPRFAVTGEISSIYKKNGKVRKVHSLILLPGLEEANRLSRKLEVIGNIHSDGRPILGIDCRNLLEIMLEVSPKGIYVPAHIWTPHFSMFGAFSGFDSMEECFEDLAGHIHAVETGLSSDPPMNWRVSDLDGCQLISNSDAHSPSKLGREANLLDIDLSYEGLYRAIQEGEGLCGTIEFFPEEGKYHFDGHRKCGVCLSPGEAAGLGGICPVCGKKLTVGVSHRAEQLSDREEGYVPPGARPYESLMPLPELLGNVLGRGPSGKQVQKEYQKMLGTLGSEFAILREIPVEDIRRVSGTMIAEGIQRLRDGKVNKIPGYDGAYGTIQVFLPGEERNTEGQMDFFALLGAMGEEKGEEKKDKTPRNDGVHKMEESREEAVSPDQSGGLNEEQRRAAYSPKRRIMVTAGPGTGKTKTLISRIQYLLEDRGMRPEQITAVTFTNQAAAELKGRLPRGAEGVQAGTFHTICVRLLREAGREFSIAGEEQSLEAAQEAVEKCSLTVSPGKFREKVSRWKSQDERSEDEKFQEALHCYQAWMQEKGLLDFDDLLLEAERLDDRDGAARGGMFSCLLVDEFQDINPLQYRLIQKWHRLGTDLFVIGDMDQAIYGFRGADPGCFGRLGTDYPDICRVTLVENYRSTKKILEAAWEIIARNPGDRQRLHANRGEGTPVRLVSAATPMGEGIFIAKEISRMTGGLDMLGAQALSVQKERGLRGFGEIAVLYRTHRQARLLEKCLRQEGIPYIVAGRETFLREKPVQDSLAFFQYLAQPSDEAAQKRCLQRWQEEEAGAVGEEVLRTMAEQFAPYYQEEQPERFIRRWMAQMGLAQDEAMEQLAQMGVFYSSMGELLEAITLGVESDLKRCGQKSYEGEAVTLMTLHGSKGLEFPVIFLYGIEAGIVPPREEKYHVDREEERRLLYVGMTRAQEELILTCGQEESEFLFPVPDYLIVREEAFRRKEQGGHQMSLSELFDL